MYQLLTNGGVIRLTDGAHIPANPANRDWQDYLAWLAQGNKALAADAAPPAELFNLVASDTKMARVGEDVINALIKANVIKLTDLPVDSRTVLTQRATWRAALPPNTTTL